MHDIQNASSIKVNPAMYTLKCPRGTDVKIRPENVVGAHSCEERILKNCCEILTNQGTWHRIRISLAKAKEILGLENVHQSYLVRMEKVTCWGARDTQNSKTNYVKVEGQPGIMPVSNKNMFMRFIEELPKCG